MMMKAMGLGSVVLLCAGLLQGHPAPQAKADAASSTSSYVQDFSKHWTTAKDLAVEVAEAMPADDYGFKPVPEEMSFGEQMLHIAAANYGYCAVLNDTKSPFVSGEKGAKIDKTDAVKQLTASFDYCSEAFSKLTDANLDELHGSGEHKVASRDVMLGVIVHMAHHRGQAEVYLRLKGIKPPQYKS